MGAVLPRAHFPVAAAPAVNRLMCAQEDRLTADSAVGAARRAGVPAMLPASGAGSDYAQLSRMVKRAGLLRRRPVSVSYTHLTLPTKA